MMASFQSQSAHGSDWEVWEGRQERRLTHALAGMHFDDRAEERDLKAEELALERRKQALRERQYRDAQKKKERAHQKARAKAEQARALEKRKERNEQALAFLRPWYSQCQSGSKRADALLREGTAAAVSANEEGKLLSEELVGRLLERRARADEAMAYVREDLNKGTFFS
ncbi:MAG: hypothetical protein H6925_05390 [Holosporaceae bacterium]|nr:MAG: hypothetical protein H6925_05390 [Holosporaceae bacterium]